MRAFLAACVGQFWEHVLPRKETLYASGLLLEANIMDSVGNRNGSGGMRLLPWRQLARRPFPNDQIVIFRNPRCCFRLR